MKTFLNEDDADATKRLIGVFIVLILLLVGLAPAVQAQVYSCVTTNGKRFFTDDPASIPAGCRKVSTMERAGKGGLSIVDSPSIPLAPARDLLVEINERREQQRQLLEEWEKTAEELVFQYKASQTRLYRTTRVHTKLQIRQEIRDIKARRDALLANIAATRLPFRDRGTAEEILTAIPLD